jgi:hypothetical protein
MHRGVHAVALDVDGAVGLPRVTDAAHGEDPDHFVSTDAICSEIVHVINQPRNAWTFAVDLRSFHQWRPRVAAKKKV